MRLIKDGIFWRIEAGDGLISKKRFLTVKKALKYYYDHQNRYGFPAIKRKEIEI